MASIAHALASCLSDCSEAQPQSNGSGHSRLHLLAAITPWRRALCCFAEEPLGWRGLGAVFVSFQGMDLANTLSDVFAASCLKQEIIAFSRPCCLARRSLNSPPPCYARTRPPTGAERSGAERSGAVRS